MFWKPPGASGISCLFRRAGGRSLHRRSPYYLTHKAEQLGYRPRWYWLDAVSTTGWVAGFEQLVLGLAQRRQAVVGTRVLVLGLSFKENCPDLRNTKVVDLIRGLERCGMEVDVVDPWVDCEEARREYGHEHV